MNLKLLLVLTCVFLQACSTTTVRDDSPATDLTAILTSVERDLTPRLLPNGKEYCAELAVRQQDQDECTADLEATVWLSNRDKERAMGFLRTAFERVKLSRNPCRWFDIPCHTRAKALDKEK